ncbi:MAG: fluoride efflux transporter CrcB [Hydrogenovibrio sp.]
MQTLHIGQLIAVGLGGSLGAMARFVVSNQVHHWLGRDFVWGTLTVNVFGSFILGLLTILMIDKVQLSVEMRSFLIVGFLGAFTTFSTFSFETYSYLQAGEVTKAMLNIGVSVVSALLAVWLGILTGKHFFSA